jgi:Ala-tRNA(Pro) deacylase
MSEEKPLPTSSDALLGKLAEMNIAYSLHRHAPIFTVEEGEPLKKSIPGVHCRNLFLRDNKEKMFLVVAANETKIDLKKLGGVLGCGRLSFGSADRLWTNLGIRQGSVNPFCIINDVGGNVRIMLDAGMMQSAIVNYHPMDNAMTIGICPADLVRFIESTGHKAEIVDLSPAAPD